MLLLEFDADQRLWQETVRDAVAKQCPPSLVRRIAEDGVDPAPLWKVYIDAGWTELTDPENAVELAIVLEELGRATDPTPFLATLTQFAPLAGDRFDPQRAGTAVYSGVTAHRDADGWVLDGTARHVLDGDRADTLAVVTEAGVFVVDADEALARRSPVFDPVLHIAEVSFSGVRVPDDRLECERIRKRRATWRLPAWRSPLSVRANGSWIWRWNMLSSASSSVSRSAPSRPCSTRRSTCTSPPNVPERWPISLR